MIYHPNPRSLLEESIQLQDKENEIQELIVKFEQDKRFHDYQAFVLAIHSILTKHDIDEVKYLGSTSDIFVGDTQYMEAGHYFDVKSKAQNIDYVLEPFGHEDFDPFGPPQVEAEKPNEESMKQYAQRIQLHSESYLPPLVKLNHELNNFIDKVELRIFNTRSNYEVFSPYMENSVMTQDINTIAKTVMPREHYELWLSLKEQHDLQAQISPAAINQSVTRPQIKI